MARKNDLLSIYTKTVDEIKEAGLFKGEAPICSPQGAKVTPVSYTHLDVYKRQCSFCSM